MAIVSPYLSTFTLNVNGFISPVKRHRVAEWIKEQNPTICESIKTHLSLKDMDRLKVMRRKRYCIQMENKGELG